MTLLIFTSLEIYGQLLLSASFDASEPRLAEAPAATSVKNCKMRRLINSRFPPAQIAAAEIDYSPLSALLFFPFRRRSPDLFSLIEAQPIEYLCGGKLKCGIWSLFIELQTGRFLNEIFIRD